MAVITFALSRISKKTGIPIRRPRNRNGCQMEHFIPSQSVPYRSEVTKQKKDNYM
jgi:hypothetical protein